MKFKYQYLVEPFDVLFFRNNKAFDFGDWYSEGIFPPLPSTFQGFVRTSILLRHNWLKNGNVDWTQAKDLIGTGTEFPLNLKGPFLFQERPKNEFYLQTPKDIVKEEKNGAVTARQNRLSAQTLSSDLGTLFFADEKRKTPFLSFEHSFIRFDEFNAYRTMGKFCFEKNDAVIMEEHYGIKLKCNKNVEEHHFYLTPYQRLEKNHYLWFRLESENEIKDLNRQYSRLGSEGRGARILATTNELSLKMPEAFYQELAEAKRFKMIFLQPGILPETFLAFSFKQSFLFEGLKLKTLYAATDTLLKISGVDFTQKNSKNPDGHKNQNGSNYKLKPMVNAVPAGSVFYFEILNNDSLEKIAEKLKRIDDSKIEYEIYSRMGYNHIVLGKII